MKKNIQKITSFALSFILMLSMLVSQSTNVFADNTMNAESNDTITVTGYNQMTLNVVTDNMFDGAEFNFSINVAQGSGFQGRLVVNGNEVDNNGNYSISQFRKNDGKTMSISNMQQKAFTIKGSCNNTGRPVYFTTSVDPSTSTATLVASSIPSLKYSDKTFVYPSTSSLGGINDFGVFAKQYKNSNDMEGNIAVETYTPGHNTGNSGNISGESRAFNLSYIKSLATGTLSSFNERFRAVDPLIMGDNYSIYEYDNCYWVSEGTSAPVKLGPKDKIKSAINEENSSYQIDFDKAFNDLTVYANAKYNASSNVVLDNNAIQCTAGIENIINLDASTFANFGDQAINIVLPEGASLIINTDLHSKDATFARRITINGQSYDASYNAFAGHVMFNFGNQNQNIVFDTTGSGVVLAPNGKVTIGNTSHDGSVYARDVENVNGEIHKTPYIPETHVTGRTKISAQKTFLQGNDEIAQTNGEFSFNLQEVDDQGEAIEKGYQDTVSNTTTGAVNFKEITDLKAGSTHYYKVTETKGNDATITYDNHYYIVKVVVDAKGETTQEIKYYDAKGDNEQTSNTMTFTNTKDEEVETSTTLSIEGVKYYNWQLSSTPFTFQLTPKTTGDTNKAQSVTNGKDGHFQFAALTYTKEGTYKYDLKEVLPDSVDSDGYDEDTNMMYDTNTYQITVEVKKDKDGQLQATKTFTDDYQSENIEFYNANVDNDTMMYALDYATAQVEAKKVLVTNFNGVESTSMPKEGQYRFVLVDKDNNVVGEATNDTNGNIAFASLSFYNSGTYEYSMKEVLPEGATAQNNYTVGGITYDPTIIPVTITVDKNMDTKVTYGTNHPTFTNKRTVKAFTLSARRLLSNDNPTSITLQANKVLTGKDLDNAEFEFGLYDENDQLLETQFNKADGSIEFEPITYSKAGDYTYTIKEIANGESQIVYDHSSVEVNVHVAKDEELQQLKATATYTKDNEEGNTFVNNYQPISIRVQKTSKQGGEPLENAVYALYRVSSTGGYKVAEQTSDKDGYMTFTNVEPGTYYFKEVSAPNGHTVDEYKTDNFTVSWDDKKEVAVFDYQLSDQKILETQQVTAKTSGLTASQSLENKVAIESKDNSVLTVSQGVSDDVTRVQVAKLSKTTGQYVEGAKMQILEKDTGKVVASWTTSSQTENFYKLLNADTKYILREVEAPEGYSVASDIEFSFDHIGNLDSVDGKDGEWINDYTINVYDQPLAYYRTHTTTNEIVNEETKEITRKGENRTVTSSVSIATGDNTSTSLWIGLLVISSIIIGYYAYKIFKRD